MADVLPFGEVKTRSHGELRFVRDANYHPPESYPSFELLKKVDPELREKIIKFVREAYYPLTILSVIEPGQKKDWLGNDVGTRITPAELQSVGSTIFSTYCHYSQVPKDSWRVNVFIKPVVSVALKSVTVDHVPAMAFKRSLRTEADKPSSVELGHESITDTGGFHQDFEEISDREGTNGKIIHDAVQRFVLNFLQNQVKYDPENKDAAQKLIESIEN